MDNALHVLEAEQAVLGGLMLESRYLHDVLSILREDDFSIDTNRNVFRTIVQMDLAGEPIDGLTVAAKMEAGEDLRKYLAQLLELTPTAVHTVEYAEIVARAGKRRKLYDALRNATDALSRGEDETDIIATVETAVSEGNERAASEIMTPVEQMQDFYAHRALIDSGTKPYVRTGYRTLDKMLGGGLIEEGLYFLAARPGVGKTALALEIAENVADKVGRVIFFSMEMSSKQLYARRLANQTGVNSKVLLMSSMTEDEYQKAYEAANELAKHPLEVIDRGAMPVSRIASIARSRSDVKLIIVDHFTLIQKPGKQQAFTEYAEIAHALKRLAKAVKAPVLCLIQLSRESDKQKGRAHLSDLRGSGATEEDADGVMILHRPWDDGDGPREPQKPIQEIIYLDKNRHGEPGNIMLSFWPQVNKFRETFVT